MKKWVIYGADNEQNKSVNLNLKVEIMHVYYYYILFYNC